MTNQEAIERVQAMLTYMETLDANEEEQKDIEAYSMAIKALEDFELQYRKGFEDGLRHGDYSTKSEFGKSMIHLERSDT